jgi:hypothetical protein
MCKRVMGECLGETNGNSKRKNKIVPEDNVCVVARSKSISAGDVSGLAEVVRT